MVVSVEQIISKLDTASEENTRLRDALRANNQLLDQKLRQFEPLVEDNRSKGECEGREREREAVVERGERGREKRERGVRCDHGIICRTQNRER